MGLREVALRAHAQRETADLPDTHEEKVFPVYVLPRHDAWLSRPENERGWSEEAIQFAHDVFSGKYRQPRELRISPSALGDDCERMLLLGFGGHDKMPFPKANAEKMSAGEFHHLRWQMEGLSAGYMDRGEVWLKSETLRCGGSGDGRLADQSLFELKSTSPHLFSVARELTKPKRDQHLENYRAAGYFLGMHAKHKLQMEAYWLVDEIGAQERGEERVLSDMGSLVYMDAGDPSALVEFRMHSSPSRRQEVHRILEGLHDWIDLNELPDMLEGCWKSITKGEVPTDKELTVYNRCAYRQSCPSATSVLRG